jgi:hypothetical protein
MSFLLERDDIFDVKRDTPENPVYLATWLFSRFQGRLV